LDIGFLLPLSKRKNQRKQRKISLTLSFSPKNLYFYPWKLGPLALPKLKKETIGGICLQKCLKIDICDKK